VAAESHWSMKWNLRMLTKSMRLMIDDCAGFVMGNNCDGMTMLNGDGGGDLQVLSLLWMSLSLQWPIDPSSSHLTSCVCAGASLSISIYLYVIY